MNKPESTTLYYREGSSDKVYQASIEPAGTLFVVNFAYGRRGSTLSTGTKTNLPINFEAARAIYDKLLREKKAKGYSEGEAGTPYEGARNDGEHTGITPQLLNPITEDQLESYLQNKAWVMQEKFDGRRVLIRKEKGSIIGINRRGFAIGLPIPLIEELSTIPSDFFLDGESAGERYHAFDLLKVAGEDLRPTPYRTRLSALVRLVGFRTFRNAQAVPGFISADQKRAFLAEAKALKKEGIVFKHLDAPYTAGRPHSGGPQLKYKFYATLSAVVVRTNTGRSVEVGVHRNGNLCSCGNVTIPVNHSMPSPGEVVEVRYLYAFPESGALFQPVYLGTRTDINPSSCTVHQLKYKASED